MEQPGLPPPESNSPDGPTVSSPANGDAEYESRIMIVERWTDGSHPPGSGWYPADGSNPEIEVRVWQRVLREGPQSQVVETLTLDQAERAPSGIGWRLTEPGTTWSQRVLWPYQHPSADNETGGTSGWDSMSVASPADVGSPYGRSAGPLSGVSHPVTGNSLRAAVTLALTGAIIVVVLIGVITKVPPQSYTTYIAPLSALAGTALGFWFGSDAHRW